MQIKRVSPRGLNFYITTYCEDRNKVNVRIDAFEGEAPNLDFECSMEQLTQGWWDWQIKGKFINEAFPFLAEHEREFLTNGYINKEWHPNE